MSMLTLGAVNTSNVQAGKAIAFHTNMGILYTLPSSNRSNLLNKEKKRDEMAVLKLTIMYAQHTSSNPPQPNSPEWQKGERERERERI